MSNDPATLEHLCRLARLRLGPGEQGPLARDLERTLVLLDQLAQAPLAGVAPLLHPLGLALPLREDEITETDRSESLLALAPETRAGYYLVPRVIE